MNGLYSMLRLAGYTDQRVQSVDEMTNTIDKMPIPVKVSVKGLASTYEAGAHIEEHRHAEHQIIHAVHGVMRVMALDATWIVPPGRGLWVPMNVSHEIRCINRVEMRTVYIGGHHPAIHQNLQVIGVSPLMREIMVRLAKDRQELQVPHLTALLLGEIAAMKVEPFRLPHPSDARIAQLCLSLRENPSDRRALTEWASLLGLSPRSLMRRIRSQTGMSFRELRRQARVMAAIERLALGHSVTSVAMDVGFDSPSAFTYAFRVTTGTTPRQHLT